jgi:hypothetical protein
MKAETNSDISERQRQRRSERERQRRQRQREYQRSQCQRLLYSRAEAQEMLSISQSTILRLEREGVLPPRKLAGSPNGKTYYAATDLQRLAGLEA